MKNLKGMMSDEEKHQLWQELEGHMICFLNNTDQPEFTNTAGAMTDAAIAVLYATRETIDNLIPPDER